uniref:Uncharacterized protein n=1 Tax=Triticum urartu TaxID=4572 RepID=A0A8R7RA22_TRIUA
MACRNRACGWINNRTTYGDQGGEQQPAASWLLLPLLIREYYTSIQRTQRTEG